MAKQAEQQASVPAIEESIPLTLSEYCIRLSANDRRVELIGGFEATERSSGRLKDTAEAYAERFKAFINKPA